MGQTLIEIANSLKNCNKKLQLIYAFNGTGKTRLSCEFKELVAPKTEGNEGLNPKILYYNAFTEDLFYWDNDLYADRKRKLVIQPNSFTDWVFQEEGEWNNIVEYFQHFTNEKLTPKIDEEYSNITFSILKGDDDSINDIKISKGEESFFIWSFFYTLLEQVIGILNIVEPIDRSTDKFNELEYVFIDDPVSSLDENNLIELAVNLARIIKESKSNLKFILTTHNPLFYNVLHNELNRAKKYRLEKYEDGSYEILNQSNDSPFSYHLFLISELEKATTSRQIYKYHFNFFRNVLEKTATFLGYENWSKLLPGDSEEQQKLYYSRIINILSHSKHAGHEITPLDDRDKGVLIFLFDYYKNTYKINSEFIESNN